MRLRHCAEHVAGQRARSGGGQALERDVPGIEPLERRNRPQQGRLAGSGRAHERPTSSPRPTVKLMPVRMRRIATAKVHVTDVEDYAS